MNRRQIQPYRIFPGPGKGIDEWATYIRNRNPQFKLHTTLGVAKSAITNNGHGIIYRLLHHRDTDLTWTAVAVIQPGENKDHPYRKAKPVDLVEPVIIHKIVEEEM